MHESATITVNGDQRPLPPGQTVEALVADLGLAAAICAVEVNKRLVRRADRDATELRPGDTVEVVTLVGGG